MPILGIRGRPVRIRLNLHPLSPLRATVGPLMPAALGPQCSLKSPINVQGKASVQAFLVAGVDAIRAFLRLMSERHTLIAQSCQVFSSEFVRDRIKIVQVPWQNRQLRGVGETTAATIGALKTRHHEQSIHERI